MPLKFKFVEKKVKRARSINYIILIQGVSKYENGLSTLFCTTFIRSYLQDDILPESCIPKYCEYVYNCTIKHNFSTLYLTLLSF